MSEVTRYDAIERTRGMESWTEMQARPDGDYVKFEDFERRITELEKDALQGAKVFGESLHNAILQRDTASRELIEAKKQLDELRTAFDGDWTDIVRIVMERDNAKSTCAELIVDVMRLEKAAIQEASKSDQILQKVCDERDRLKALVTAKDAGLEVAREVLKEYADPEPGGELTRYYAESKLPVIEHALNQKAP